MTTLAKLRMIEKQINNYHRLQFEDSTDEWFWNDHYIDIFALSNKYVLMTRKFREEQNHV